MGSTRPHQDPPLTEDELELLHAVDGASPTLGDLFALLGRDPEVVVAMADRLLAAGLLQPARAGDGRLVLTSEGLDAAIASVASQVNPEDRAVRITPYRDGPLVVRGPFRLVDQDGRDIDVSRKTVALCRCGKSRAKPFCDGTHKLARFAAPSRPSPEPLLKLVPPPR